MRGYCISEFIIKDFQLPAVVSSPSVCRYQLAVLDVVVPVCVGLPEGPFSL